MTSIDDNTSENETQLKTQIQARLGSRVRHLRVVFHNHGVILQGRVHTYYTKQLAQHLLMEITNLPILANEIEVG